MTDTGQPWPKVPELAEVYDVECSGRWDHDFYLRLADDVQAESIVDLGCGTGVFAVDAAKRGRRVVGVDPAAAVLDIARNRPGGETVSWIEGDLSAVPTLSADLVIMMGHVAQYFVSDDDWNETLQQIRRVLIGGGHLCFETRNPGFNWAAEWTKAKSEDTYPHPRGGEFTSWVEVQQVETMGEGYTITHEGNTILPDQSHLRALETLRFRSPSEVRRSLEAAGFDVVQTWGDWNRGPFTDRSREFIVLARARPHGQSKQEHVGAQLPLYHELNQSRPMGVLPPPPTGPRRDSPYQPRVPIPPGAFVSPRRLATACVWLAVAMVVSSVVQAALATSAADQYRAANNAGSDWPFPTAYDVVALLSVPLGVAAYIVTCLWLRVVYRNARQIDPDGLRRRAIWVWLGWVVPIVSFWFPKEIVDDSWRITANAVARQRARSARYLNPTTGAWWASWVVLTVLTQIDARGQAAESAGITPTLGAVVALVAVIALALWVPIVRSVTAVQDALVEVSKQQDAGV